MKIYKIKDDYIDYLRKSNDPNIKMKSRPYVGIVLEVNSIKYFAPLGSPKPKHLTMKEKIDFIKLDNGNLGVINLNNMIPVTDDAYVKFDFSNESVKYQNLIYNQINEINKLSDTIEIKAAKLYNKVVNGNDRWLKSHCTDFKALEILSLEYKEKVNT